MDELYDSMGTHTKLAWKQNRRHGGFMHERKGIGMRATGCRLERGLGSNDGIPVALSGDVCIKCKPLLPIIGVAMGIAKALEGYQAECEDFTRVLQNYEGKMEKPRLNLSLETAKVVCVTNGTTYLGLWIVRQLLLRGYIVRLTVHNTEELQKLREMEEFESANSRLTAVVANMVDLDTLSEAFNGCYGVFHTSTFIDPEGVSGYTEQMVKLEVKGAENVIEACSRASTVRRCVMTSSLVACIWQREQPNSVSVVDETCWSDEQLCRDKKVGEAVIALLWFALAKTMLEKAAWTMARERCVNLVTMCPALIVGPGFPFRNSTSAIAYMKGGREMFESSVLASVDVRNVALAHVCVYEEMEKGACGRHMCFDRRIFRSEDARDLEKKMNMKMGFDEISHLHPHSHRLLNVKLTRLICSASNSNSCRHLD
eukprot:Gb_08683 [translate_table: standard]